jgi:glycosyltransferase involved in cell wall biosynthesis
VPDLEPFYARSLVSVAPIRYGAGVKGKIGDALRHGLPVVSTPMGVEGMGLEHEKHVLIGESAPAFADEVVRLWSDRDLWTRLSENGFAAVVERFSPAVAGDALAACLGELCASS